MADSKALTAYKVLFSVLGCCMAAVLLYTIITDGSPFRPELLTPWLTATLIDFYVNVVAISFWIIYRESNILSAIFWIMLLICFGSIATCAFVVIKLFEITSRGTVQDPIDLLLLRNDQSYKMKRWFVSFGRVLFSVLGIFMFCVVSYTVITDGLPFRIELLTPWMAATLIDFYINVVAIAVWVAHKEATWISSFIWIVLLVCFGSITTCAYIVIQLFRVSSDEPVYHLLLNAGKHPGWPR